MTKNKNAKLHTKSLPLLCVVSGFEWITSSLSKGSKATANNASSSDIWENMK